jgi:primosomal protein N' (replication factor Y)
MKFADVILPLAVPQTYTFGIPIELQADVRIGCRVEVQFGQRKIYSGLVKRIHNDKPDVYTVKPIRSVLDKEPVVTEHQLKFWEWVANYYACTEGDVMNAALPAHLKLVSETYVVLNEDVQVDAQTLTDDEFLVLQALEIKRNQLDGK